MKAFLAATLCAAASVLAQSPPERCRVVDGDSLRCGGERIRLKGIYAPERSEPGGEEATRRLQVIIQSGQLRIEPVGRDRYDRVLAFVYVDGRRVTQSDIGPAGGNGHRSPDALRRRDAH